jgi:NAD(P)H dehydrogenase (quinone)
MNTVTSIAGGTGLVGGELTRTLLRNGIPVRVLTRDPAAARARFGAGPELTGVDFDDPATLRTAFAGVDRAFLGLGTNEHQVAREIALIDAAVAAGVPFLVTLSVRGSGTTDLSLVPRWHGEIDAHLAAQPVAATVLRPATFTDTLLKVAALQGGAWGGAAGTGAVSSIDSRDVAAVAATVLGDGPDRHAGRAYDLTGPGPVTMPELARLLSAGLGRTITYRDRTEAEQRAVLTAAGVPDLMVEVLLGLDRLVRSDASAAPTGTVRELTGRPPRSVAEFVAAHLDAFAAPVPA